MSKQIYFLKNERIKECDKFKYLGSVICKFGKYNKDIPTEQKWGTRRLSLGVDLSEEEALVKRHERGYYSVYLNA